MSKIIIVDFQLGNLFSVKQACEIVGLKAKISADGLNAEIDSVVNAAGNIEKALYQTKNRSPQDPLNFPIRLNNKYGHVGSLASIGFQAPTAAMYGVKAELEKAIDAELQKWKNLKAEAETLNNDLRATDFEILKW